MIPTRLIRIIRQDEKKYMINSSGLCREYAVMRASIPKMRKRTDKVPIIPFLTQHDHAPGGTAVLDNLLVNDFKSFIIDLLNFFLFTARRRHDSIAVQAIVLELPRHLAAIGNG
jgi:hypothetical protein